ncbi:nucleotidyltransferase family protein [Paenibacillus sinensis]|nr:nucleotidyltransferase family protein [Paenibacillus sinensis]
MKEEQEIQDLIVQPLDWGYMAGQLYHHRLTGYFLRGTTPEQQKGMHSELIRNMKLLVRAQRQATIYLFGVIKSITEAFDKANIRYAGLKGLVFNYSIYNPGDRRSNDGDFLVVEEDLSKVDKALRELGFIQSLYRNEEFTEATRIEKMIQRMNYHDLVPYVKKSDSELFDKLEIDINFHFDSKNNDITKKVLEYGTVTYGQSPDTITGLPWPTHMAHLCSHFFREATDTIWTETKRDVLLYKVVDIMNTFRLEEEKSKLEEWVHLMQELNLDKVCYYTLYQLRQFYDDDNLDYLLPLLEPEDTSFLDVIHVSGKDEATITRQVSFYDSAFDLSYPLAMK